MTHTEQATPSLQGTGPSPVLLHLRLPRALTVLALVLGLLGVIAPSALAAGDANQATCSPATESSPGFRGYMPDCRAFELVSPAYGGGAPPRGIFRQLPPMTADGEQLLTQDFTGFAETGNLENAGFEDGAVYEFSRIPSGWSTEALDPHASLAPRRRFDFPSADLNRSLWELFLPPSGGEELPIVPPTGVKVDNDAVIAVREAAGAGKGHFALVGPIAAPGHEPSEGGANEPPVGGVLGASAELTHIVFNVRAAGDQAWPGDDTLENARSLYEYEGTGEAEPVLVAVSNEGSVAEGAAREGKAHVNEAARLVSRCGVRLGNAQIEGAGATTASGAVSASGGVVLFTALACAEAPKVPVNELYARVNASHTLALSEPAMTPAREGVCSGVCREDQLSAEGARRKPAFYQGASRDGSKVFFTTEQPLLNVDKDTGSDLYEAELEGLGTGEHPAIRKLVMISQGAVGDPTPGEDANVGGVAEISESGARVYFESTAVLTSTSNGNGEKAKPDVPNLYVYDTETGDTAFVAREAATVGTTADGEYLVFDSARDIEGTNDTSKTAQLFEYDAATETVVRVSSGQKSAAGYKCEATHLVEEGYNCDGNTSEYNAFAPGRNPDESHSALPAAGTTGLVVSKEGTVVFVTGDPLAPGAVAGGENIYEYPAGNVYLISPGSETTSTSPGSREGSRLLGISENGQNVLFATTEQLVPQDTDTQSSWYDARESGGFPAPPTTVPCQGEICQGALNTPPVFASPGSNTLTTSSNLAPPAEPKPAVKPKAKPKPKKCRKGEVRKHGTCAKVKAKKSNRGSK
jgi:hypothetical protein